MITRKQVMGWHPCSREPGERYDDEHLDQLFDHGGGHPWVRVAAWPIPRGDVIWLATRPGALTMDQRDDLVARIVLPPLRAGGPSPEMTLAALLAAEAEQSRREVERFVRESARMLALGRAVRRAGEMGWGTAAYRSSKAMRYAALAADEWAACAAWEACMVAEWSGLMSWEEQVEILLEMGIP